MRRSQSATLALARLVALAGLLAVLTACGPDAPATSAPAATGAPSGAGTAAATTSAPGGAATAPVVTPERLCSAVSTSDMARIAGFPISQTRSDMSGDVAVCHYIGTLEGYTSSKIIIEYQPHGKVAMEYTKAHGEAVTGLGEAAVWFATSGNLEVELGGEATFGVYVEDLRFHHNDARAGARQVADIAVPALAHL